MSKTVFEELESQIRDQLTDLAYLSRDIEASRERTKVRTEQALAELKKKISPASWPPLCKDGPEVFNMPALKDSGIEHPPIYGISREDGTVRFVTKEEHDAWRASKTA